MFKPTHSRVRRKGDSLVPAPKQPKAVEPLFEMLEPRLLYSADAFGIGAVALPDDSYTEHQDLISTVLDGNHDDRDTSNTVLSENTNRGLELVFIDSRVTDAELFIDVWSDTHVEFVVIDNSQDALNIISETLTAQAANGVVVDTIKIVSHGSSGSLLLGKDAITESSLKENSDTFQQWSTVLAVDADILLFGCDVGAGEKGHSFVRTLAELTDADVAASDNITGSSLLGGDWNLEVSYGATRQIDPDELIQLADWTFTLATIQVNTHTDDATFNSDITISDLDSFAEVTLRMAVVAANNTAGDDTIELLPTTDNYLIANQSLDVGISGGGNLTLVNKTGGDVELNIDPNQSDTRFFTLRYGTFDIVGDPDGNDDQVIFANGGSSGNGGAILTEANTVLNVSNVRFENNKPDSTAPLDHGGAIYAEGELNILDSEFVGNVAGNGGAIFIDSTAAFSITNTLFENNESTETGSTGDGGGAIYTNTNGQILNSDFKQNESILYGGGIYSSATQLTIENSQFEGNIAPEGSAIISIGSSTLIVNNSAFNDHQSGSAIFTNDTLHVNGSTFNNNNNDDDNTNLDGGAIDAIAVNVSNSVFTNNSAGHDGGAINATIAIVSNSVFSNNSADSEGGAIHADFLQVTDSLFDTNEAGTNGGAIKTNQSISVSGSHFVNNLAIQDLPNSIARGGAISTQAGGSIVNSSFVENSSYVGAAIALDNLTFIPLTVDRVTFSGNIAELSATLYSASLSTTTVTASTFADNTAGQNAAAIHGFIAGRTTVESSLFFNNTLTDNSTNDLFNVNSLGNNLFDTNTDAAPDQDIVSSTLNLGPLTPLLNSKVFVRPLLPGSDAINAGSSTDSSTPQPHLDAQGLPLDALPDIGASEFQGDSDTVYWSDDAGQIWRSNSHFSNPVMILDTATDPRFGGSTHDISGLAIDFNGADNSGNPRLFWVDKDTGNVWFANLDGSGTPIVLVGAVSGPSGPGSQSYVFTPNSISFDSDRDLLFLTHGFVPYHPPAIRIWDIDENSSQFVGEIEIPDPTLNYTMIEPRDIHYSDVTGRLYWIDGVSEAQAVANQAEADAVGDPNPQNVTPTVASIHSSFVDGTGYEIHHLSSSTTDDFRGITMDDSGEYLFFTNIDTQKLHRLELANGTVTDSVSLATLGNLNGAGDLTFLSTGNYVIATNSQTNEIHKFDTNLNLIADYYTHSTKPVAITTASTTNPSNPTFYTDSVAYTESNPAITVDASQLIVNAPPASDLATLEFIMITPPSLGGVLTADGTALSANDTFNLNQIITFESHDITFETTEVIQLQLTDGNYTTPTKAFYITITPVDDPGVLTIEDFNIDENSPPQTLSASDFTFTDEENDLPHSYTIASASAQLGLVVLVNNVPSSTFTHAQLVAGEVAISSEATELTSLNSTAVPVTFNVQPFATNGQPIDTQNPIEPGVPTTLTVNITPVDDPSLLTAHSAVDINDNSESDFLSTSGLLFNDEESGSTPLSYSVTNLPDPNFVTLMVDGSEMTTPGSFTHDQLINGDVTLNALDANIINSAETTSITLFAVTDPLNPDSNSNSVTITVNVQPQDDPALASTTLPLGLDAYENSITPIEATYFSYSDEELQPLDYYEIVSIGEALTGNSIPNVFLTNDGNTLHNSGTFTLTDLQNGLINIDASAANLTSDTTLHITLRAHSQGSSIVSDEFILQINLIPVNDAPVLTALQDSFTVTEGGSTLTIPVGNFIVTDEEGDRVDTVEQSAFTLPPGVTMTPALGPSLIAVDSTTEQSQAIEIDAQNGVITGTTPVVQTIEIYTTQTNSLDGSPGQDSNIVSFTITIIPTDDTPTFTTEAQQITEGDTVALDTNILNYQDEESPTDAVYTLSALGDVGGAQLFINGVNHGETGSFSYSDLTAGNVEVRTDQADYEDGSISVIHFSAAVVSGTGQTAPSQLLTLEVTPVNEPASLVITGGDFTINEHTSESLPFANFDLIDEETTHPVSYQISTSLAGKPYQLLINGAATPLDKYDTFTHQELVNGDVILSAVDSVLVNDYSDTIFLTALLEDGTTTSPPTAFNIVIQSVNDAPMIAPTGFSMTEGDTQTLAANHFNFTDEETPSSAVYTLTSLNDLGGAEFIVNGNPQTATAITFTHTELLNNLVQFNTQNADYPDSQIASLNFSVQVESGGQTSTIETWVISVNPVNEQPVFTITPSSLTVTENDIGVLNATDFSITDEEGDIPISYLIGSDISVSPYTIELISTGAELSLGDSFTHQDLIAGNVVINASDADIDTPLSQTIELIAEMDSGPGSVPTLFTINIEPANDAANINPPLLQVIEGTFTQLNANNFNYTDEEDESYAYVIDDLSLQNGTQIVANGIALGKGDTFYHQDVLNGNVFLSAENTAIADNTTTLVVFDLIAVPANGPSSASTPLNVMVMAANDNPTLSPNLQQLSENATLALYPTDLGYNDEENDPISHYIVDFLPDYPGLVLTLDGVSVANGQQISPADLASGKLVLDATETDTSSSELITFGMQAVSANGNTSEIVSIAVILNPTNDPALLSAHTGGFSIDEGTSQALSSDSFLVSDEENAPVLHYVVHSLPTELGVLVTNAGTELQLGDTFTQQDLDNGQVTVDAVNAPVLVNSADELSVFAVLSDGTNTNIATMALQFNKVDDSPTLTILGPIEAYENSTTPINPELFVVEDLDGELPTHYTLIAPVPDSLGSVTLNGQALQAGDTFTQADLESGQLQIDLQTAEISTDTNTTLELAVTTGQQSSTPTAVPVFIHAVNDAPILVAPIALPTLSIDEPAAFSQNAFTDPEDDELTYTAWVVGDDSSTLEPLPTWLSFNPETQAFTLLDTPTTEALTIQIVAEDTDNATTSTNITLQIEPVVAPALPTLIPEPEPETQGIQAIESPVIDLATNPTTVDTAPESETAESDAENDAEQPETARTVNTDDSGVTTTDIESARIDLSDLLTVLDRTSESNSHENGQGERFQSELADLLGFTNDSNAFESFQLNDFESKSYNRRLGELAARWDSVDEQIEESLIDINTTVGTSVGLSSGFTVGYMIWLLRGGTLMGSVLSSLPAWRLVDPLPVLAELDDELDDDNESLESMVSHADEEAAAQSDGSHA